METDFWTDSHAHIHSDEHGRTAEELVTIINNIIINPNKDIDFIDGANHGYHEKEELLAKDIVNFINKN